MKWLSLSEISQNSGVMPAKAGIQEAKRFLAAVPGPRLSPGRRRKFLLFVGSFLLPSSSFACAVCFNPLENHDLSWAFLLGALILITFAFLMIGGLVAMVYRIESHRSQS